MSSTCPKMWVSSVLAAVAALGMTGTAPAQGSMPKVGDMAPDFKLEYVEGKQEKSVTLSQYRGKKNVVVAFYIFAFTGG